jgi:hypothetical protein
VDPLALALGLLFGGAHVVAGPDHVAALAPIASVSSSRSWAVGLRWGLGHCGGVLLVACAALYVRDLIPIEALSAWSERTVGVALIGVGAWGLLRANGRGFEASPSARGRAAFAFGTLHGLAGSSHLLGVLPALAHPTRAGALAYLAGFAAGTVAAMALVTGAIGWFAGRAERGQTGWRRRLCGAASAFAIAVGVVWLAR